MPLLFWDISYFGKLIGENTVRYIKPDYYDDFTCVAAACPDTCCAGWQIVIDEESLEKYSEVEGAFGRRLVNSIDWQEGCFYQYGRRCAFLNDKNLCDLYTELGEGALCATCKNYPRHTEEYEGLRELSLSLSCPIAAQMILSQEKFPEFVEYEDDKEEELVEEFEDFDLLMFTQLEDARMAVFKHLREAAGSLEEKMSIYLEFARRMQECIDCGKYFEVDAVIRAFEERMEVNRRERAGGAGLDRECPDIGSADKKLSQNQNITHFSHRVTLFGHIYELERLRDEWSEVLNGLEKTLYQGGENQYNSVIKRFETFLEQDENAEKQWENTGLQLFVFFFYTYFCGAVYDDRIYSKVALAVESVRFIRELYLAKWVQSDELTEADYVEFAYRYAREIEHSDLNLNDLEDFLESEY